MSNDRTDFSSTDHSEAVPQLVDWLEGRNRPRRRDFYLFHLKEVQIRLASVLSLTFVGLFFSLTSLIGLTSAYERASIVIEVTGLVLVVFFVTTLLTLGGIAVWQTGRWLKEFLAEYWVNKTPPHVDLEMETIDRDAVRSVWRHLVHSPRKTYLQEVEDTQFVSSLLVGLNQLLLALAIQAGTLGLVLYFDGVNFLDPFLDDSVTPQVSIWSAVMSILLGPVFGVFALGIANFSTSIGQLLGILLIFGVPLFYFGPGVRNLQQASDSLHRRLVENDRFRAYPLLVVSLANLGYGTSIVVILLLFL